MNNLHQVIYQIVSNPEELSQAAQHTHAVGHKLGLAYEQVQALAAVLQDPATLANLLTSDSVRMLTNVASEMEPWVPPGVS